MQIPNDTIATIIVAAGRGQRFGSIIPKQWHRLGDKRVIDHTIEAFSPYGPVVVVLHRDHLLDAGLASGVMIVEGGATRSQSVRNGLTALSAHAPGRVLIHDAARPFVDTTIIDAVLAALETTPGAAPGLAVTDALWRADAMQTVSATVDREALYRAQTPQGFHYGAICAAYETTGAEDTADDVAVARAAGMQVKVVAGAEDNFKITYPQDIEKAERVLSRKRLGARNGSSHMDIRCGNGYDVHRFGAGNVVTLCGVDVPHSRGLQGHSDADVGMHAITDAIYGALAMGDIGQHFPPSDPQWKGAASRIFLEHARDLAQEHGFSISHVDCTLVCEYPKIGPHADAMREAIAAILQLDPTRVSVKATTSERLGFTGREEGIAALATATLVKDA